jgi:hypothetical protein
MLHRNFTRSEGLSLMFLQINPSNLWSIFSNISGPIDNNQAAIIENIPRLPCQARTIAFGYQGKQIKGSSMKGKDADLLMIVHRSVVQMGACGPANSSMEWGTINCGACDVLCLKALKYFTVK